MRLTFAVTKTAALLPSMHDWPSLSPYICETRGELFLLFQDPITREDHQLPVVHSYRHLGGILTATANPKPDLLLRQSQVVGFSKPLRKQLFSNRSLPIKIRRTLLQALSASRLVHTVRRLYYQLLCTSACGIEPTCRCGGP